MVARALNETAIPQDGDPTGYTDCHLRSLLVGDRLLDVQRHDSSCCEHRVTCTIRWNADWGRLGMQADDGEWVSGMGIASSYARERK
jgi:hypothetical protein